MTTVLGICSVLVTVTGKRLSLYVSISTSGCDGWLQQRNCHGIDAVWTRRAARDCSGVDAKGVKKWSGSSVTITYRAYYAVPIATRLLWCRAVGGVSMWIVNLEKMNTDLDISVSSYSDTTPTTLGSKIEKITWLTIFSTFFYFFTQLWSSISALLA